MFPNQIPLLFLKDTVCTYLMCCQLHSIGLLGSSDNLSTDLDIAQLRTTLQKSNSYFDHQQVLTMEQAVFKTSDTLARDCFLKCKYTIDT